MPLPMVALLVASLIAPAAAERLPGLTVKWGPRDVRVSDSRAQWEGDQETIFETSVAIDPRNPRNLLAFAIDLSVQNEHPDVWSVTRRYRSTNGGKTWSDLGPMRYTGKGRDITSSGDPVVVFDGVGNAYYASLAHPPGRPDGVYVHRSTDAGATWNAPVAAVEAIEDAETDTCTGTDKEWIETDRETGTLYLAYTLFTYSCSGGLTTYDKISDLGIYLTKSTDRGKTWTKPREIWSGYALGAMPRVGPDGTLYIGFWGTVVSPPTHCPSVLGVAAAKGGGGPFASIVAGASTDGGKTWNFHQQPICGFLAGELLKPGSFVGGSIVPSVAVDPDTGAAYVAYPSFLSSGGRFSIDLIKSEDGGESWSAPVVVTPGPADARVPALAADGGVLRLVYVESMGLRDQDGQTGDGETRTLYTESVDGGATWSEPFALSTEVGHPTEFTELGDYNTLAVEGRHIVAMWSDARNPEVNGEIWARVGTLRPLRGADTARGGEGSIRAQKHGSMPIPVLAGLIPTSAPTHRALTPFPLDPPRSGGCGDRQGALSLARQMRRATPSSLALDCSVAEAMHEARIVADDLGLHIVFQEYEGFEGEVLLAHRGGFLVVKVVATVPGASNVTLFSRSGGARGGRGVSQ